MTSYELYINGVLCDLPGDEVVTLRYQSPVFSGLDVIQSNRSYEISLPLTSRNRKAIGFAERLDVDAEEPYVRIPAALYQEGVPLFTTGYAVITEISDVINVVLTWGNVDNFQPLFDANLQDLGEQLGSNNHIDWNENTKILDETTNDPAVGFYGVDFGMGLSDPKYLHPSVNVAALLAAIEKYNGITIEGKARLTPNLKHIIPLVTKNGDSKLNYAFRSKTGLDIGTTESAFGRFVILDGKDQAGIISNDKLSFNTQGVGQVRVLIRGEVVGGFSCNIGRFGNMEDTGIRTASIYISGYRNNKEVERIYRQSTDFSMSGGEGVAYFPTINEIFEVSDFELLRIELGSGSPAGVAKKLNAYIEIWGDYPNMDVIYPSLFPVAKNLPDMTQGDFVLTLMSMYGLFAYADKDSPNTIKLISIEDIYAQQDKTIDWSDKVLLNDGHDISRPDNSIFTLDDFAQRNILDYDNDDDVKTDTHGLITVRNENIEKEADLVELPFSASENTTTDGVNCALVPLYEKKDDKPDEADYSKCSPRILAVHNDQSYNGSKILTGRFDGWMKFGGAEGLVPTYYGSYQKVVDRIRLVRLRAKLTALDLMRLDYTKPVYLSQFGQAFAIYSVETGEDGICDCELIHLRDIKPVIPVSYFLRIAGKEDGVSITVPAAGTTLALSCQTNGTVRVSSSSGIFDNIAVDAGFLYIVVERNPEPKARTGRIRATLTEDTSKLVAVEVYQRPADVTRRLHLLFDIRSAGGASLTADRIGVSYNAPDGTLQQVTYKDASHLDETLDVSADMMTVNVVVQKVGYTKATRTETIPAGTEEHLLNMTLALHQKVEGKEICLVKWRTDRGVYIYTSAPVASPLTVVYKLLAGSVWTPDQTVQIPAGDSSVKVSDNILYTAAEILTVSPTYDDDYWYEFEN